MQRNAFVNIIFDEKLSFFEKAMQVMQYQYSNNLVYQQWNEVIRRDIASIASLAEIPFLPISFFKTHRVVCGEFEPAYVFESSGTSQSLKSRHYVKDAAIYKESFLRCFNLFYNEVRSWCIIGLLPSYLERENSSLVLMTDELIKQSDNTFSGFYLYDFDKLKKVLATLENRRQKVLLMGVTFALLDFAEQNELQLKHTVVMETGGMKGRRKELTREEAHSILCKRLGVERIHSEYGMTELLSQAYSKGEGRFYCPPWMKVFVRDEEDPLSVKETGRGVLNIIDLANIYSCSFIATDDVGIVHEDGSFQVLGRVDNCDIRGCSLLVV